MATDDEGLLGIQVHRAGLYPPPRDTGAVSTLGFGGLLGWWIARAAMPAELPRAARPYLILIYSTSHYYRMMI